MTRLSFEVAASTTTTTRNEEALTTHLAI